MTDIMTCLAKRYFEEYPSLMVVNQLLNTNEELNG